MVQRRGFTLLELLVVMSVIGILTAIALATLNASRAKGRDANRAAQSQEFIKALEMYYTENGRYPDDAVADSGAAVAFTNTSAPAADVTGGGFIHRIPSDPFYDATEGYYYCASDLGNSVTVLVHLEDSSGSSGYCVVGRGPQFHSSGICTVDDPILGTDTDISALDSCIIRF